MNGAGLVDAVMLDIGKIQTLTTDTNLRVIILNWVNRVCKDIYSRSPHWVWGEKTATFDTVADQLSYDLPSDIDLSGRKVFDVRQKSTPVKLTYVDQRLFDTLEPDPTSASGFPTIYTLFAESIRLWPTPSEAIEMHIRYVINKPTAYTDAADSTSEIPTKYEETVLSGVRALAFKMFPSWGKSNQETQLFELKMQQMESDNKSELDNDNVSRRHPVIGEGAGLPWNRMDVG